MKDCMNGALTKAEESLIKAIRNINDPDEIVEISNEISHTELKVSLLLVAADLIAGESLEKQRRNYA